MDPDPPTPNPVEEAIFHAASEVKEPGARATFLDRACGSDGALRARIETLLAADLRGRQFLAANPLDLAVVPGAKSGMTPLEHTAGDQIGRYKLLEKIGEGGMGVVYMAEQREPVVRRVALKIIKAGMDTRQVVARFEAERQALALMDHPNIAKVLDGGATESGRPYFVMDLVQGLPMTQFCDEVKLPMRERLELFVDVCSAIQHAHQKGIIHRDIKPSNILVTLHGDKPVPKVIDFGIAKATQQRLTDKTLFTQFQHFVGTPTYMSPEQASLSGLDIDTRSDIYGLGVLLYELLTGKTPFDAKELLLSGLDEIRRTIREKEPPRPSTRLRTLAQPELSTTASHRRTDALHLIGALTGDLDWVVMKCLEKDRARRYETATGLAADVRHYLNHEAVSARPPTATYRFSRMVARHRIAFAGAATVLAALVLGFTVSAWLFLKERDAHRRAVAAEKLQAELRRESDAARRQAEAGKTALLYWQAFEALPLLTAEEQQQLRAPETIVDPTALAARYNDTFKVLQRAASIGSGCDWAVNSEDGPWIWTPEYRHIRHVADAAFLRADIALSRGDPEGARRDLWVAFVLARHAAVDVTLATVMAQCEVESRVIEFLARHFGQFSADQMTRFVEELRAAPPRVGVAQAVHTEHGGTRWIVREIQRAQLRTPGDEAQAILRARECLDVLGATAWVDETIAAAGGTAAGLLAYIGQTEPYYEMLQRIAVATPAELQIQAATIITAIEMSTNLVVQRVIPNVERVRRREMETLARLAMLESASAYQHEGQTGLQSVLDPFGKGPLVFHPTDGGFELRSSLADHGYSGSLVFLTAKDR